MSISYKIVAKGQPGVVGGGITKYYASIVRKEPVTIRRFAVELADRSTLTRTDIVAVLEAFMEKLPVYLADGRTISFGALGSFSPSISSLGEDEAEDVNESTINKVKVIFRPSKELKTLLKGSRFTKLTTANGSDIVN